MFGITALGMTCVWFSFGAPPLTAADRGAVFRNINDRCSAVPGSREAYFTQFQDNIVEAA